MIADVRHWVFERGAWGETRKRRHDALWATTYHTEDGHLYICHSEHRHTPASLQRLREAARVESCPR